jgi:hypothetical protein
LIVLVDDLHRQPTHLSTEVVEREFEGVPHVLANRSNPAAESGHEADLHFSLLAECCVCDRRPFR